MRPASSAKDDGLRFLQQIDSQLPWLATVGAQEQWGSETRSNNPKSLAKYRSKIEEAEADAGKPWSTDAVRIWIVETTVRRSELDAAAAAEILGLDAVEDARGMVQLPVGSLMLEGKAADYVESVLHGQDEKDPFAFIKFVLTDRRAGALSRGAGAYAIQFGIDYIRELGFKRVCLDCWSGNGGRLAG